MAQQKPKERQIGKKAPAAKKPLIDPRYKNPVVTGIIVLILLIFFIYNNTRPVPDNGPYPPTYDKNTSGAPANTVDPKLDVKVK